VIWVLFLSFFRPLFFSPPFPSLFTWTGNGALMRSQWRSCKPFARTALESSESSSSSWFPIQQEQHVAPLVCLALPQVQDSEWQIRKWLLLFILFWRLVCNVIVEQPLPPPVLLDFTNDSCVVESPDLTFANMGSSFFCFVESLSEFGS
jgi:hypothetical protein